MNETPSSELDMLVDSRILVVEDNEELQGILADFLEVKGAEVDFACNGLLGLNLALKHEFDAIILDVMMPKKDGMQVAKELRENGITTPILMLTALNGQQDLLAGFESGVDDFVSKPFQFPELEVRLISLIKRYKGNVTRTRLNYGDLSIEEKTHRVTRLGIELDLTPATYQILLMLVKAKGEVVSRDSLIQQLWGEDAPDKDILRSHIYLLRNVLDKPFDYPMLVTVPKFGFKLVAQ
ncbi:response regulator transcription factor [Vibrio coralliilyticus]|uniref:response regulator transcription factor n=1 Tax=Vibrio coralliilyticus TaxID=190893 RepID=UPI000BAADDB1|nr:response regulator transcription factor [Vibrio coralliilyticus]NOI57348.1 response regulator transcription factor [Vibrio coralliilyticus]PAT70110.1 DNA-binding response regulator [Vibrio coralliilyticus]